MARPAPLEAAVVTIAASTLVACGYGCGAIDSGGGDHRCFYSCEYGCGVIDSSSAVAQAVTTRTALSPVATQVVQQRGSLSSRW